MVPGRPSVLRTQRFDFRYVRSSVGFGCIRHPTTDHALGTSQYLRVPTAKRVGRPRRKPSSHGQKDVTAEHQMQRYEARRDLDCTAV